MTITRDTAPADAALQTKNMAIYGSTFVTVMLGTRPDQ
jgi:hypothetical protein